MSDYEQAREGMSKPNITTELDKLLSAQVFLRNFKDGKTLQFFSGEGESLILTKWLLLHGIKFDGLFSVTEYGKFWKVHEEAGRKWQLMGGINLNCLTVSNKDGSTLFYFGHNFHLNYSRSYYNANSDVVGWAKAAGYQNVIMGFRKADCYRHCESERDQKQLDKALSKATHSIGKVPTETNLNIWFPLYDLEEEMKTKLLQEFKF